MKDIFLRIAGIIDRIPDADIQQELHLELIDLLAELSKNGVREYLIEKDLLEDL